MKIRREIRIGFVVIVAIALFIWGANYLKGTDLFKNKRLFYAQYGRIEGLVPSNPVVINGLKVGQVSEVYFHPKIPGRIMVKLSIDNEIVIPYNSIARIYSSDLMGSKAIEIQLGNSEIPAVEGDTLISMIQTSLQEEVSIQMLPLKKKIEDLVGSIDSVVAVIQVIFNDETRENLVRSFESIRNTIASIEHTSYNLDTLMASQRSRLTAIFAHVESITLNLKNNNEEIANIISNVSAFSDTLARTNIAGVINKANDALVKTFSVMDKIDKGEGSLGMLVNNDTLYQQLEAASKDLDLLMEDLRLNPNRYIHFSIFGRNPKKNQYQPPPGEKKNK